MTEWLLGSLLLAAPFALLCLSFQPTVGAAGLFTLCNAGWCGTAAYTFTILYGAGVRTPFALAGGLGAAVFAAACTWLVCVRARGFSHTIATLAVGFIIPGIVSNLEVTGGERSLLLPDSLRMRSISGVAVAWSTVLAGCGLVALLRRSALGIRLLCLRDMEVALEANGLSPAGTRLAAYVSSGLLAGMAGLALPLAREKLSPATFNYSLTLECLALFVLAGGLRRHVAVWALVAVPLLAKLIDNGVQVVFVGTLHPATVRATYFLLLAILLVAQVRRVRP